MGIGAGAGVDVVSAGVAAAMGCRPLSLGGLAARSVMLTLERLGVAPRQAVRAQALGAGA